MNNDLRNIWNNGGQATPPDINELTAKAQRYQKKNLTRILFANITMMATGAAMVAGWYFFGAVSITTKAGIILMLLSMVAFLFASNRIVPILKETNPLLNASEYLKKLITFRKRQGTINRLMINAYYVLLATGLSLYLFERTAGQPLSREIITYALPLAWIGYNWLYKRPLKIKKQQAELDDMISRLEAVNRQL